jgi:phospholipase/carboxylesterase
MDVAFARRARDLLEAGGIAVDYHESDVAHEIDRTHIAAAARWLVTTLQLDQAAASSGASPASG